MLPTPIGDEAVLLRHHYITSLGGPTDALRLLVRDGAFLLDLLVKDWTNTAPPAPEAIQLVEVLRDRLQEVLDGTTPELSASVYRLDPDQVIFVEDTYRRRSDQQIPKYQQPPERIAAIDARYRDLGVIDSYRYAVVWIEGAGYSVDILHFGSNTEAAANLRELADQELEELALTGVNQEDVTEVTDLSLAGDDSIVVISTVSGPGQRLPEPVYVAWIRVGDRVAEITLIAYDATASKFEPLAQGQVECLQSGRCWEGTATLGSNS